MKTNVCVFMCVFVFVCVRARACVCVRVCVPMYVMPINFLKAEDQLEIIR